MAFFERSWFERVACEEKNEVILAFISSSPAVLCFVGLIEKICTVSNCGYEKVHYTSQLQLQILTFQYWTYFIKLYKYKLDRISWSSIG